MLNSFCRKFFVLLVLFLYYEGDAFIALVPIGIKVFHKNDFSNKMTSSSTTTEADFKSQITKTWSLISENIGLDSTRENIENLCIKLDDKSLPQVDKFIYETSRKRLLVNVLKRDRQAYINLSKSFGNRIPRNSLPNLQDIPPFSNSQLSTGQSTNLMSSSSDVTVINDCSLPNITFTESILDTFLLSLFRKFVQEEIKFKSPKNGILGLLEEGRYYYLSDNGTPDNQHKFVRTVLGRLLTPFLPPFYRIFMAGIVPSMEKNDPIWLVNATNWIREQLPTDIQNKVLIPGKQYGK